LKQDLLSLTFHQEGNSENANEDGQTPLDQSSVPPLIYQFKNKNRN